MTIQSTWTGSSDTSELVKKQIFDRWGDEEAKRYNPNVNCLTFGQWKRYGYNIKKGEKALRSYTFVEAKDKKTKEIRKIRKTICLFCERQVEPQGKTN